MIFKCLTIYMLLVTLAYRNKIHDTVWRSSGLGAT